eukprot:TRINITY_DN1517_c0_g1_i1.p1 TRINITY_DN1517_c0_g1~~TRINITY_DN1517_c0_g1_i1.p1  ORF type:complete len:165 (-),score=46.72 TRINITY_DN1517_c0_g1_i1:897-1391(-)
MASEGTPKHEVDSVVDTPATPTILTAKISTVVASKSLENKLLSRVAKTALIERNILLGDSAPALQNSAKSLERSRRMDALSNKLKNRPTAETLVHHNIMHTTLAVDYDENAHKEKATSTKQQTYDLLSKKILSRPPPEQLVLQNIIPKEALPTTPSTETPKSEN